MSLLSAPRLPDAFRRWRVRGFAVFAVMLLSACGVGAEGRRPPPGELNFPLVLATSAVQDASVPPAYLYVASSNFDLRYNTGSLMALDLNAIDARLSGCPAPCVVPTGDVLVDEVFIPSNVSAMQLGPGGQRLYLAIRSDADLSRVDVRGGGADLQCGAAGDALCGEAFRFVDPSEVQARGKRLPADPTALAVGELSDFGQAPGRGTYVLMAHRFGEVSLTFDAPELGADPLAALVDVSDVLGDNFEAVAVDPDTREVWLASSTEPEVARIGVSLDAGTADLRQVALFARDPLSFDRVDRGVANQGDGRVIRFDRTDSAPRAYILARLPAALVIVDLSAPAIDTLPVRAAIPVGEGPSRFAWARFAGRRLAFVTCFDSQDVYVIDLDAEVLLAVVGGMSGPFDVVVDEARQRLYIADFRSSVVHLVDLAPLVGCLQGGFGACTPTLRAQIGVARPVEELR
ncbi:MAG: YncE family protein [Polyangiales bacterium]